MSFHCWAEFELKTSMGGFENEWEISSEDKTPSCRPNYTVLVQETLRSYKTIEDCRINTKIRWNGTVVVFRGFSAAARWVVNHTLTLKACFISVMVYFGLSHCLFSFRLWLLSPLLHIFRFSAAPSHSFVAFLGSSSLLMLLRHNLSLLVTFNVVLMHS